jgi:biopolymer transport protein ExbB/TolQ
MNQESNETSVNDIPLYSRRTTLNVKYVNSGMTGTAGLITCMAMAGFFHLSNQNFLFMLFMAIGLLVWTTGKQITTLVLDNFRMLYFTDHVKTNSADINDFLIKLRSDVLDKSQSPEDKSKNFWELLKHTSDRDYSLKLQSYFKKEGITQNSVWSSNDIQRLDEFLTMTMFNDAEEHYKFNFRCLDFVGTTIPIVGMVGTVLGLLETFSKLDDSVNIGMLSNGIYMAMETTLWGGAFAIVFKTFASRFGVGGQALTFDFEEILGSLRIILLPKE